MHTVTSLVSQLPGVFRAPLQIGLAATLVIDGEKTVLHLIPSGILREACSA